MSKIITIYTGSFKPPHKGHLFLVKKMLKMTTPKNKIDYPGIVYIFISKKERKPCDKISGEVSRDIWKEYIETLPEKDRKRVKLIVSKLSSPTQTAYGFVNKIAKKGDIFYLVKSIKNASNSRFLSFKTIKTKGVKFNELILPGYENLNSTDMRKALNNNDKKTFYNYLPDKMNDNKKNQLWITLKNKCKI
jgi:phosphopantetheine adenylyltransferase